MRAGLRHVTTFAVLVATVTTLVIAAGSARPAWADGARTASCSAGTYHGDVTVRSHQEGFTRYIDGISVRTGPITGLRNRIRIEASFQGRTVFQHSSGDVPVGAYSVDLRDKRIKIDNRLVNALDVKVVFVFDGLLGRKETCSAALDLAA